MKLERKHGWLLIGIAIWNFVVWGLYHGSFLVAERIGLGAALKRLWSPLQHLYLMLAVMIGWVFFRADSLVRALVYLKAMAGFGSGLPTAFAPSYYITPELMLALIAGVIGSMPVGLAFDRWRDQLPDAPGRIFDLTALAALVLVLAASMLQVAAGSYSPFIYFRF